MRGGSSHVSFFVRISLYIPFAVVLDFVVEGGLICSSISFLLVFLPGNSFHLYLYTFPMYSKVKCRRGPFFLNRNIGLFRFRESDVLRGTQEEIPVSNWVQAIGRVRCIQSNE